jgi:predicted AlkP superfamily phosphohydrolase/phosphomutase
MSEHPRATRVLMLGLDGYDAALGERLMAEERLPALSALAARSARFPLDHGAARRTGLGWEHVSSGQSPQASGRFGAVHFDRTSYAAWQAPTSFVPFTASLARQTVVFDAPYFDISRSGARGVVNWGAHDPGVPPMGSPAGLQEELLARFGGYPATRWLYAFTWPSAKRTEEMGRALVEATGRRADAAEWLLRDRLPGWDLAFVVVGEPHSASEALWHGVDSSHPLHALPSAGSAADALYAVYEAVDRLVARLVDAFPEATMVAFMLHGMGPNHSDVASMAILPELLYRRAFGSLHLEAPRDWVEQGNRAVAEAADNWTPLMRRARRRRVDQGGAVARLRQRLRGAPRSGNEAAGHLSLSWMPAAWYQAAWERMPAFALPSFYDGQVRVNLAGREARGRVPLARYEETLDSIAACIQECRDLETGEPVVAEIVRTGGPDPLALGPTEADMIIVWRSGSTGFTTPGLGAIGPFPVRRTGGHTGGDGVALVAGPGIPPGPGDRRSAFDVVPTVFELLGAEPPAGLSGESLFTRPRSVAPVG